MRAVKVDFRGVDSKILWTQSTQDRSCVEQKYIMNVATDNGSDTIFPDRGTDLLASAIAGSVTDDSSADALGEFAATDTIYFCSWEEDPEVYDSDYYVEQVDILPVSYSNSGRTLNFRMVLNFRDGTSTDSTFTISDNG